jgi:glycine/D-amino acid oxidase-like deaminating enzyme
MKESTAVKNEAASDAPWQYTIGKEIKKMLDLDPFDKGLPGQIYDIAVVGGGVAGLSAARAASARGASVVLLERAPKLGLGASGKSAGILGCGANLPLMQTEDEQPAKSIWQKAAKLLPELYAIAKGPTKILKARNVGGIALAKSDTAAKRLRREARERNSAGLNAEIISVAKLRSMTSGLLYIKDVKCALHIPDDGRINPLTLLAYYVNESRQQGCTAFGGVEIVARRKVHIGPKDYFALAGLGDSIAGSGICGAEVRAKVVIYATGPIANANKRLYAISYKHAMPDDFPLFWDANPSTCYDYRSGDGYFTVTGGRYGHAGQTAGDLRFYQAMINATAEWVPQLQEVTPTRKWAVDLEVSSNTTPEIVCLSRSPLALSIEGLGALGALPGLVLGAEAAQHAVEAVSAHRHY